MDLFGFTFHIKVRLANFEKFNNGSIWLQIINKLSLNKIMENAGSSKKCIQWNFSDTGGLFHCMIYCWSISYIYSFCDVSMILSIHFDIKHMLNYLCFRIWIFFNLISFMRNCKDHFIKIKKFKRSNTVVFSRLNLNQIFLIELKRDFFYHFTQVLLNALWLDCYNLYFTKINL